ncbi:hypothetical protein F2Q70_00033912 [Brassica cretica]|uniref:Cytokinin riboside 5'-monophosphate phosphoribohydrolase n=1 Tax=Brassica cretica TaxID=69181 RepID=A0A8S9JTX9_BRACR|nr:hypothetical protein F2Q70_00033912 [Brassica cretica]
MQTAMDKRIETVKSRFKRVCVFCGSSSGNKDCYGDAAIDLAQELIERKLNLVYGGGSIGLMGLVSQAVHEAGGHVLGIIPRTLMDKEITGETFGEVRAVADMHQRKAEMASHSDCFIALPGGYGTLEELLEVITWAQLGIHDKPVRVDYLSVAAYDDLIPPHLVFLKGRETILVEGLKLDDVKAGVYSVHCLPLRLVGAEGSPIRCILIS